VEASDYEMNHDSCCSTCACSMTLQAIMALVTYRIPQTKRRRHTCENTTENAKTASSLISPVLCISIVDAAHHRQSLEKDRQAGSDRFVQCVAPVRLEWRSSHPTDRRILPRLPTGNLIWGYRNSE